MSLGTLVLWLLVMAVVVVLNGLFVATEYALVAVRRSRVRELLDEGHPAAPLVYKLQSQIDTSVSGTQLGITLASLALGWIGEPTMHQLSTLLLGLIPGLHGVEPPRVLSILLPFLMLSVVHVVIGEQVPKFIALSSSEKTVLKLARPYNVYRTIFFPMIWLINSIASLLLKLVGVAKPDRSKPPSISPEELTILIEASRTGGELDQMETDILKRALDLKDLTVDEVMVPRKRMDCISDRLGLQDILSVMSKTKHSKLPVYSGNLDHIKGVLNTRDLWDTWQSSLRTGVRADLSFKLRPLLRPAFMISKDTRASALLDDLRSRKIQLAIVVDAGKTLGLVTMEDLLEQLVGEIFDEYDPPKK